MSSKFRSIFVKKWEKNAKYFTSRRATAPEMALGGSATCKIFCIFGQKNARKIRKTHQHRPKPFENAFIDPTLHARSIGGTEITGKIDAVQILVDFREKM